MEGEVKKIDAHNSLLALKDSYATMGHDWKTGSNCMGKEGVSKMNNNRQLCVTNTYFAGRSSQKTTWQHPLYIASLESS